MSTKLDYFSAVAKKRPWQAVPVTKGEFVNGSEETIFRALAIRHLELPVKDMLLEGLERELPNSPGLVESIIANRELVENTYHVIFTHDQRLLALGDKFKWVPAQGFWIKEPKIYEKSKMISMISSNKAMTEGQRTRLQWVEMLEDQIDIYGRGINEIALKEEGLCDYMFSVVIENGFYESYFTEKILDCFATGTIPVYKGSPDIGKYFNKDGIIDLNEEFDVSEELYFSKMNAIKENLEKAKEYEVLEDFIYLNYFKEETE